MAAVVPAESIPNAISVVTVVQMAGEVLAPLLFALVSGSPSLAPAFLLAALAYAPAALLPLTIRAEGRAEGAAAATAQGGRAAVASLVEGLRYILDHPLLPGLYALDWGLTLFTFYRELVRPARPPTARAHTLTAPCTHSCRALACPRLTPRRPSSADPAAGGPAAGGPAAGGPAADPPPRMTTCLPHASHSAPPVARCRGRARWLSIPRLCAVADAAPPCRP